MKTTIYSKNQCPKCMTTKLLLGSMGVEYVEKNIDENEAYYAEAKEMSDRTGYTSMPITLIGENEPVFGFQPDVISELINQ